MTPPRIVASELADWIRSRSVGVDRYLFGLAGAPGSGKSTLARDLGTELDAVVVPMVEPFRTVTPLNARPPVLLTTALGARDCPALE